MCENTDIVSNMHSRGNQMKPRILAIAPYEGLRKVMEKVAIAKTDMDITVEMGDLEIGLAIAKKGAGEYDAVVSRGGTAILIAKETDMPVIEIPLSSSDLLYSIKLAQGYNEKMAIAGYTNITVPAKELCDVLGYNIDIFTIDNRISALDCLQKAINQGCHVIISDFVVSEIALKLGLSTVLVSSSEESVSLAFDQAKRLSSAFNQSLKQKILLTSVLKVFGENILLYNSDGTLWLSSLQDGVNERLLDEEIKEYIPNLTDCDSMLREIHTTNSLITLNIKHLVIQNSNYYLVIHSEKKSAETRINEQETMTNIRPINTCSFINCGNSATINRLRNQIARYAMVNFPVMIVGESGTGKAEIAEAILNQSSYKKNFIKEITCEHMTKAKWEKTISEIDTDLFALNSAILFSRVESLSKEMLMELGHLIRTKNLAAGSRLFFTYQIETGGKHLNDDVRAIIDDISCLYLEAPSLRERIDDMQALSAMAINKINISNGKRIIGLEKEALDVFKNYSWPGNMLQFQRVLNQVSAMTESAFIGKMEAISIISQENPPECKSPISGFYAINLNQDMNSITKDIAHLVLKENNYNQTATAKRLGISRTTLWRIMQQDSQKSDE